MSVFMCLCLFVSCVEEKKEIWCENEWLQSARDMIDKLGLFLQNYMYFWWRFILGASQMNPLCCDVRSNPYFFSEIWQDELCSPVCVWSCLLLSVCLSVSVTLCLAKLVFVYCLFCMNNHVCLCFFLSCICLCLSVCGVKGGLRFASLRGRAGVRAGRCESVPRKEKKKSRYLKGK